MAETVLVVENDDGVREMLSLRLGRRYDVTTAPDGRAAWDRLSDGPPPAAVVLDLKMPRMDGFELLARLERESAADVPVIVVSSDAGVDSRRRARRRGVAEYLVKPFDTDDLLAALRRTLGGGHGDAPRRSAG